MNSKQLSEIRYNVIRWNYSGYRPRFQVWNGTEYKNKDSEAVSLKHGEALCVVGQHGGELRTIESEA